MHNDRINDEEELHRVIDKSNLDNFPMTEPTVILMTADLHEKLRNEKMKSNTGGDGSGKYLWSCHNYWRVKWSQLIIVVAIYSVIFIPMKIAVYRDVLGDWYDPLDIFTYMLYILDVFINLRTTYLDRFGEEIKNPKQIVRHYVYSVGFWIDLLSLLNYPMGSSVVLSMIGILKINRVLRISTLITQSSMEKSQKIMMQMLYYYMLFIIYLHLVACLWFYFVEEGYKLS